MDERRDDRQPTAEPDGDYGYDLVHETLQHEAPRDAPPQRRPAGPTYVPTQTGDADGDYGYDLAHEIPPSTGR